MTQPFIDTDVIIRLLTGDDLKKQAAATVLFEKMEKGLLTVVAPDTVIADAVFVLSHFRVQNRTCILRALELYASTKLDFGDTLIIASMEEQNSHILYSYDNDFDHIQGITRREP